MTTKKSDQPAGIEELTEQYHALNERKIQAETQLKEADKRLKELQKTAESEFGTSDVAKLEKKLKQMEAENEKRRADYQKLLSGIQADLDKIEAPE